MLITVCKVNGDQKLELQVGVLISVRTAESVELGQVVWTKPPERLPWEPEGPHLLICFKRHQKSTKEAEFLNF